MGQPLHTLESVLAEVSAERAYQDGKWGGQYDDANWTDQEWGRFILEYLPHPQNPVPARRPEYDFRKQLIKVAALAVAAAQHRPKG